MTTAQEYIRFAEAAIELAVEPKNLANSMAQIAIGQVYATLAQAKATDELHTVLDARLVEP